MKVRPILFSTEMVRQILDGRKTQTRRVIKPQPVDQDDTGWFYQKPVKRDGIVLMDRIYIRCPYGKVGDRLWVRETWGYSARLPMSCHSTRDDSTWLAYPDLRGYKADGLLGYWCWKPSILMPRWASRIGLEIISLRVERLQKISLEDVEAEGLKAFDSSKRNGDCFEFIEAWNKINGKRGFPWISNPWVWVIEFKQI